jgi:phosphoglycerol transferase MdoB-like AlkP superfamily enzyme
MSLQNPIKQLALRFIEWLGSGLVILIVLERFNQGGTAALRQWFDASPTLAFYNLVILLLCYGIFRVWFAKPLIPAALYSFLMLFVGTVHYLKLMLKGEPLLPMDIFNIKTAAQIAPNMDIHLYRGFWLNVCFVLFWLAIIFIYQQKLWRPLPWRRVYIVFAGVIVIGLGLSLFSDAGRRSQMGIIDIRYNQNQNYRRNGFTAASLTNMTGARIKTPEGYNEAIFKELLQSVNLTSSDEVGAAVPGKQQAKVLPNIIVLQMEAYSDPRLWDPGLELEPDPFSPLKKHQSRLQPLKILTSVLGGSTATTEFEFLTGYNMSHAPQGIMPFVQYMGKQRPSLVWDLAKLDYLTVGIHPNIASFYARNEAYPNLGFADLIDIEDFVKPKYVGYYVSDQSVLDKIKETIEGRKPDKPLFCFTVSIQNHGPYSLPELNRPYEVKEGQIPLNELQIQTLRNFSANILDSSEMLAELLDYLDQQEEPYLVLAYGDHHANWDWGNQLPDDLEHISHKYLTEGFFWTNYPLEYEDRSVISANYLSTYLLKYAGIPLSAYYQLLYDQAQQVLGYNPFFIIEKDGSVITNKDEFIKLNQLIQYDRMFGKGYLDKLANQSR